MLRIGGGEFKGRMLKMPQTKSTRPSTALFRKSIFDSCQSAITEAVVADLFAGSGILGIEALSRGAKNAYFIDLHHKPIKTIKENLSILKLESRSHVMQGDVYSLFPKIKELLDIAFIDPPYTIGLEGYQELLMFLKEHKDQFADDAHIYLEVSTQFASSLELPDAFALLKEKKSSTTTLLNLQKKK